MSRERPNPRRTDAPTAVPRDAKSLRKAVALLYDGHGAPRVTAKGQGLVAETILARAREHGVPLHEDAALAGALAQLDLGEEIPEALYRAVAQVLAFTYFLSGKTPPLPVRRRERG